MHQDARTTVPAPSERLTVPRLMSVPLPIEFDGRSAPRWLEFFRDERGYTALTVVLDIWSATCAVALGVWWTSGPVGERGIAALSWLFVPIVIVILTTRSMYKQKLNHRFLDDVEPVETSVAVAALGTLTIMMLAVPQLPTGGVTPSTCGPARSCCGSGCVRRCCCPDPPDSITGAAISAPQVQLRSVGSGGWVGTYRPSTRRPDEAGARLRPTARRAAR